MARDEGLYALIFNGLTMALPDDLWMPLSERERIAAAICDTLDDAGIEIRRTGLDRLWRVAAEVTARQRLN